jgi:non-heme chloroperoxidase
MDHYADDLAELLGQLDVRDAALVGFSPAAARVARYIGRHGNARVRKAALVSAVPPIMVKTARIRVGCPSRIRWFPQAFVADRRAVFRDVPSGPFFGYNRPGAKPSQGAIDFWCCRG